MTSRPIIIPGPNGVGVELWGPSPEDYAWVRKVMESRATDRYTDDEQKAYRRGKSDGYTAGVVDGWDACMKHVQRAFDAAVAVALKEPETVKKHREAAQAARDGR